MKHIKTYEKYIHTSQDKIDDMILMQEFADKFEKQFEDRLDINYKSDIEFRSYLGFGAEIRYEGEIIVNNRNYYKTQRNIKYKINLSTDINPAGITGADDIGRTFVINFDIKPTNTKYSRIPDFYDYKRNMYDVLEKFNEYIYQTLNIQQLSDEEKEQKRIKRKANKYNL